MDSLHLERHGERGAPRLALLHGFTQTSACWPVLADSWALHHEVLAVDLPRHGASAHVNGDLVTSAELLAAAVRSATIVGYSMGARYALTLAVHRPDAVEGLVLISGTAGIQDAAQRATRRDADEARAVQVEHDGMRSFLDDWLAQPLFADVPAARSCRAEREKNAAAALAASLREAGTGSMEPLWDRLHEIRVPTLLVTGERDEHYDATAQRMRTQLGGPASHTVIEQAGHAAHLVDPDAVVDAVRSWQRETL